MSGTERSLGLSITKRSLGLMAPTLGITTPSVDESNSVTGTGTTAVVSLTHASNVLVCIVLGLYSLGQALTSVTVAGANSAAPTAIYGGPDVFVYYYYAPNSGTDTITWVWSSSHTYAAVAVSVKSGPSEGVPLLQGSSFRVLTNMLDYDGSTPIDPDSNVINLIDANMNTVTLGTTPQQDGVGQWHLDVQLPSMCAAGTWILFWAATFADGSTVIEDIQFTVSSS